MSLIIQTPWTSQPQVPVRLKSPGSVKMLLLPSVTNGLNLATNKGTIVTNITRKVSSDGVVFAGQDGVVSKIEDSNATTGGSDFTVLMRYKNNTAASYLMFCAGKSVWSNSNGFSLWIEPDTNTIEINGGDSYFPTLAVTGIGAADNKFHTLAVKYAGTTATVAFDGRYIGSLSITAAGVNPSGIGFLNYPGGSDASYARDTDVSLAAILDNSYDIVSLSRDPWQVFQPLVSYFPVGAVAAGGGVVGHLIGSSHLINGGILSGRLTA